MKNTSVISFSNVSKRYRIRVGERIASLVPFVRERIKRSSKDLWAIKDLSLELARGEALGIIGRNGAGKSTILKLIAGVTSPTMGKIQVRGRVAPLIEIGGGLHPELTGRENIFFNGAVLGMKRKEILAKFDDIVRFAEIEEFLETPLKRYSSGMQMRLGFSIAVMSLLPIYLIDEVLAVGDADFQAKCLERIEALRRSEEHSIMFVSHNMNHVRWLCDRVIVLNKGSIHFVGDAEEGIERYEGLAKG